MWPQVLALIGVALALSATLAHAQAPTVVAVDFGKATLSWTPGTGEGGDPAAEFVVRCGAASGQYTIDKVVPPTQTSVPVKDVITVGGSYFCAVQARNDFGVSAFSNEVAFRAGRVPVAPGGFTLSSQ